MGSAKRRRQQQHAAAAAAVGGGGGATTMARRDQPPAPFRPTSHLAQAALAAGIGSHGVDDLTPSQIFKKALKPNGRWTKDTFPQFLDVVYWFRQVLAIVIGVVWGRAGSRGAPAIISWVGLNIMLPRAYYTQYARVDEDDFDPLNLLKEGFQPSFGLFFVAWIVAYNFFFGDKLVTGTGGQ